MLLLRNPSLVSAFRFKPSILPDATRRFLATSSNPSPSQIQKKDDKPKPHRYTKKEISPPFKRPMASFVAFTLEKMKQQKANSDSTIVYADTMRECAAAWKKLSETEKKSYGAGPEMYRAYRDNLKKWYEGLSLEARRALRLRRRRKTATGFSLFVSETFKGAKGSTLGERIAERSAVWKSLGAEKREDYSKRAAQTLFGVRARRAGVRERQLERAAAAKRKAAEKVERVKKAKEKAAEKAKEVKAKAAEKAKKAKADAKAAKAKAAKAKAAEKTKKMKEKLQKDKARERALKKKALDAEKKAAKSAKEKVKAKA